VQHYQKVVEKAAEYQIAIDAHEPIKETGIRRTWPNMMTREGARGMEWNAWSEGNSAEYQCILPFVRLLGGPMDYTPGVFDIYYKTACATPGREEWNGDNSKTYIKTTLARQIANWVLIYSPLQMACDLIENYEGHPAFQFFRDFDPDCDWSEALAGEIGDYLVIARRAGDRFFLGAGTNQEARTVSVALDFLEPGVTYEAAIYADDLDAPVITQPDGSQAADKTCYRIEHRKVTSADTLEIMMAADGGQAISFIPVR
jgi:alpha-glucosidase